MTPEQKFEELWEENKPTVEELEELTHIFKKACMETFMDGVAFGRSQNNDNDKH